jgi:DNA polymerase III delta subunit
VLVVSNIAAAEISEKDAKELAELFSELESAVIIISILCKDKRSLQSKTIKTILTAAEKVGFAMQIEKASKTETLEYINECAKNNGVCFESGADLLLFERINDNWPQLSCEIAKLAAICGYGEITKSLVKKYSASNIEVDVFELTKLIIAGNKQATYAKIYQLFEQNYSIIAIAATLATAYVDMLRVCEGVKNGLTLAQIAKDFAYTNEYRLKKAKENAAKYSMQNLQKAVVCLCELDEKLKSTNLQDKSIFLITTATQLIMLSNTRR